ncbi:MAG: succinate dehydrogenase, cytochrome b556 subunit [Burkholderiales bacterium]|jgi:succinate dehydrogenase / fumarate reductase cytochrome b subunit|nr:succinate dehydrogenase, cytochrome b556 subunit [Burkholderiales bacterium]
MPDAAVKKKRPVWYNLNLLDLPLAGFVSILHRISGALLFLLVFFLLYLFDASLASPERFDGARAVVAHPLAKLVLLGLLWAFLHHFCAGIRYLFLDLHKGLDRETAKKTSAAVMAVSLALTAVLGGALLW